MARATSKPRHAKGCTPQNKAHEQKPPLKAGLDTQLKSASGPAKPLRQGEHGINTGLKNNGRWGRAVPWTWPRAEFQHHTQSSRAPWRRSLSDTRESKKKGVRVATSGDPPQQGSGRRKGARICKASPSPTQDRPRILPLQRQSQGLLQPLGQDGRRLTRSAGHCVREALPSSTRGWRFLKELEMRPESFMAGAGTNRSKLSGREPVHCP